MQGNKDVSRTQWRTANKVNEPALTQTKVCRRTTKTWAAGYCEDVQGSSKFTSLGFNFMY
jgi:hypothetical protein